MPSTTLKQWSPVYSVGITTLDQDHQRLLDMINRLYEAMSTGQSKTMIVPLINDLKSYTMTHFKSEEEYLAKQNHPTLEEQKAQHKLFISKINEFETELNKGNTLVAMKVMPFLNDWLLKHIMDKDKQYAK